MNWTLDNALPIIRNIAGIARDHGFGVALRGSVLERGESENDLDLFFTVEEVNTTIVHVQACVDAIAKLPEVRNCTELSKGSRPYCAIQLRDGRHIDAQFESP